TMVQVNRRQYNKALDELERLVVQRLFELTKLGMSGIGYKLREKIGKALKARAETIKKALKEYNVRAAKLQPPREPLTWNSIVELVNLADFDLLRESREDIRSKVWAQPANRKAMNLHFNVKRAKEEIDRVNVGIQRLFTAILDEHADFHRAIKVAEQADPVLAHELKQRWRLRDSINADIAARLWQTSQLQGFSG
ncbi:hypothetical protein CERSUDRAFT_35523, partial [Gelatoporia subvermispora B]